MKYKVNYHPDLQTDNFATLCREVFRYRIFSEYKRKIKRWESIKL